MSITTLATIPCRACGSPVTGVTVESANPVRHPPFQEKLLDRTLLRIPCPRCGSEHEHYRRFMWADLPGRLCIIVVHESEKAQWPELETDTRLVLTKPFREEGPPVVRTLGEETEFRLAFGLEELREKVVCRLNDLDDRVVEALKQDLPYGCFLDAAAPGESLTYTEGRPFTVGWDRYEQAAAGRDALAVDLPGLFDPLSTWVNAARSRRVPVA